MILDNQQGIVSQCENGHEQRVFTPSLPKAQAESLAELLDGTSPMYRYPPRDFPSKWSTLAKCGICGGWFTSTLFGYDVPESQEGGI